jgi:hypothetical protein
MSVYDSVLHILYVYLLSNLLFIRCVNLLPPPEDVVTLPHAGPGISAKRDVDSTTGNLTGTFPNDKLMVTAEEGSSWIYKNKDHGS